MQKLIIPLLTVMMVVSITLAGCIPATSTPGQPPEAPPEEPEQPPEAPELPPPPPPPPEEFQELIVFASDRDGDLEIYLMSPDGSTVIKLTDNTATDATPSLSPDGKKIAFDSDRDGNREIYVMNSDGSNVVKLTSNSIVDLQPSWSPDSKKIAFRSGESVMSTGIYVINADGTNLIRLTEPHAFISDQAWSPDGSEIVFASERDGELEIYVMNAADGSNKRRLIEPVYSDNEKLLDAAPAWSPVGGKMVFYSFRHGFEGGTTVTGEIFGMDEDGSNLIRLTHDPANLDYEPSWSPDGEKIVFASERDGDLEIYIMNSDGSNVVKLTDNTARDSSPSWALVPVAPPETPELPPAPAPVALPKPGEWTAATGASEFEFTSFTVSPDSTSITLVTYDLKEFTCGPTTVSGKASLEKSPPWTITGGQFTIDWEEYLQYGPNWDIVIQGRFDETGTQASGTWEISAEGTACQEGAWEASAP